MAQKCIEALFGRLISLDISDDGLRCHLFPMLDHASVKSLEVREMPIEAATRDAELTREHVGLQSVAALMRQCLQCEIDPGLSGQSLGHGATIQHCIDSGNRWRIFPTI